MDVKSSGEGQNWLKPGGYREQSGPYSQRRGYQWENLINSYVQADYKGGIESGFQLAGLSDAAYGTGQPLGSRRGQVACMALVWSKDTTKISP